LLVLVSKYGIENQKDDESLYSGLIRLRILHHAAEEPLYGAWIAEEPARPGYGLNAGILYLVLHGWNVNERYSP
jgi:hypothetical protein